MGRCSDARDRILHSAARLFHERGYSAVSVADICSAAELKKGSFYHFFPSKRDLVLATIDAYAAHQARSFSETLDPDLSALDQLKKMFSETAGGISSNFAEEGAVRGCPLGNLALEMAHRDPAIRDKISAVFAQWRAGIAMVLRRGVERGELEMSNPDQVAEAVVAYFEGAILLAKANNDPTVLHRLAGGATSIVRGAA